MDYEQALEWVHSLPRLAAHPGVENTRRLLEKLGNPEKSLRFVHVAGTNGKGSATVMLASVLHRAGYRVGAGVSPYVLEFRERFLLDGEMISRETLAQILTEVRAAAEGLRAEGWDSLVEFDAVTAATLLWFARERCDIVCLEVGLGGRLDSTNAVENTLVACIMCIGRDHTELLGDTYAAIAGEKCGILKNNCTVISYPAQPQEAMDEITLRAAKAHCPLVAPDLQDLHIYKAPAFENRVNYGGYDLVVPFPGVHQAYNAAVVVEAALALCEKGFDISDEAILGGIAGARFPARIEVLSRRPLVVLDGAHNPDGARALAATLRGLSNDVYFQVALLTTIGLSSKNAILIVEFAESAVDEGYSLSRAAIRAAQTRLRPIVMTSLAFIAGVMPLAIATGAGANSRIAIGTGIIGGTLTATLLAIFFVPLFFVLVKRLFAGKPRRQE